MDFSQLYAFKWIGSTESSQETAAKGPVAGAGATGLNRSHERLLTLSKNGGL